MKNLKNIIFLLIAGSIQAQNKSVSIGTLSPDPSAVLDLESPAQGFLMPRLDSSAIPEILSPAQGLMVFNRQDECYYYKKNLNWSRICSTDSFAWLSKGNSGTVPLKNFLGTIDNQDLVIRTANLEHMRILSNGNIGIGYSNPSKLFCVGIGGNDFQVDANGVTYLGDGGLTLPQLTFINDPSTGLYRPGANQFALAVGGNQGLWFDSFTRNIYLGLMGTSAGLSTGSGNVVIGKGSVTGGGGGNFSMGYTVNGLGNTCLATCYSTNASTVSGTGNLVLGFMNTVSAANSGVNRIIGDNNNVSPTCTGGGDNFIIGTNNINKGTACSTTYIIGDYNTISGGVQNSIAIGGNITVEHSGNVALSDWDGILPYLKTQTANQMIARFTGGYAFYSDVNQTTGAVMASGGGWASVSDRNVKENFREVSKEELLQKFLKLKACEWQFIAQRPDGKLNTYKTQPLHIGLMAQDFNQMFGYGEFDNRITQTDIDGVMTVAIQALAERTEQLEALGNRVAELQLLVNRLIKKLGEQK